MMRPEATVLLLMLFAATASAATISGYVLDNETGLGLDDMVIEAVPADGGPPTATAYTDIDGHYTMNVPAGAYDVYVRLGKDDPKKTIHADAGEAESADFKISLRTESQQTQQPENQNIFFIIAAFAVLAAAAFLLKKHKKPIEEIPEEKKQKTAKYPQTPQNELDVLKDEKERLKKTMAAARKAYEQREINEERLKEVMSDHEESLAEVQKKIQELEAA